MVGYAVSVLDQRVIIVGTIGVEHSRRSEVEHSDVADAAIDKIGTDENRKCGSQGVSSYNDLVARIFSTQTLDLTSNILEARLLGLVEALMHVAVGATWRGVSCQLNREVVDPVLKRLTAAEDDINRLLSSVVADVAVSVVRLISDGVCGYEPSKDTSVGSGLISARVAVCILSVV